MMNDIEKTSRIGPMLEQISEVDDNLEDVNSIHHTARSIPPISNIILPLLYSQTHQNDLNSVL